MDEKKELIREVEQFCDKIEPLFKGETERGIVIMAVEDTENDNLSISALVRGSGRLILFGIADAMDGNKDLREVIRESVSFYDFKNNPLISKKLLGDDEN